MAEGSSVWAKVEEELSKRPVLFPLPPLEEVRALLDLYYVDRSGVQQMKAIVAKSREHIADLERKQRDLQAQIDEFREVEATAVAMLDTVVGGSMADSRWAACNCIRMAANPCARLS